TGSCIGRARANRSWLQGIFRSLLCASTGRGRRSWGVRTLHGDAGLRLRLWLRTVMHKAAPSPESQRIFAPGILADQVAIITGGGSGIGLATAAEMLRLGARVAICGRSEDKLAAARDQLAAGERLRTQACDIREPAQV